MGAAGIKSRLGELLGGDDTGLPKKGSHSVGVTHQYCGQLGKKANCQVAVSLSLSTERGSLPVQWRLYVPERWANDPVRRAIAGIPPDLAFATKPALALAQIRATLALGWPAGIVLAVDTASTQGWRRPLLAWLGVQAQRAEAAGDTAAQAAIERRRKLAGGQ